MHNLQLTDDQEMVVDTVKKFVVDSVAPKAQELDEHRTFVRDWCDALAELGVYGLSLAEDKGGAGMGLVPFVAALEAVGEHSGSLARLWIGQMQAVMALESVGGDLLDELAAGSKLAAFIGAEHGFTFADGRLTGSAAFVPAALEADVLIVVAGDAVVQVDASACTRTATTGLGLNSAACGRVECDGVGATELAGADAHKAELVALVGTAAAAVGAGVGSVRVGRNHAAERIAFGKPLLAQQAVQRKLVESTRRVEAARQLTWHAARLADLGGDAADAAAHARITAVDAAVQASDEAIQILGGYGYTVEYHAERHYRDAKTFEVLDGGSNALRDRLAAKAFA